MLPNFCAGPGEILGIHGRHHACVVPLGILISFHGSICRQLSVTQPKPPAKKSSGNTRIPNTPNEVTDQSPENGRFHAGEEPP